jgi:Ca2+-binding EF-hand superfamily protein
MKKTGWPSDPSLYDTDKDGKITVFELAARFAKKRQGRGVEPQDRADAAKLLKLYDKNKNGFIDLNELVADRSAVGLLSEDVFLEFDSDANQKMSRMEVATYLSQQRRADEKKRPDPFR